MSLAALWQRWRTWRAVQKLQALTGAALLTDTLVLLALRKLNAGTVLPGLIGLGLLALLWAEPQLQRWRQTGPGRWLWRTGQCVAGLWLASFISFVALLASLQNPPLREAPQVILILGAGLRGNAPSPILYNRLDVAIALARRFPASLVVTTGGKGLNEASTEALAMQRYLLQQGVAPGRIVMEEHATSTEENMRFSRELLAQRQLDLRTLPLAIVTSDFHAARSRALAEREGFQQAVLVTAPTPVSIVFNVWLREYFAWIWHTIKT